MLYSQKKIEYNDPDNNKMCGESLIELLDHAFKSPYMKSLYVMIKKGGTYHMALLYGRTTFVGTEGFRFI